MGEVVLSIDEKGTVRVKNTGKSTLRLWKLEVEYTTSLPGTLYTGEKARRLRVKESFKPEKSLSPGESYELDTGLSVSSVNRVVLYYQREDGRLGKSVLEVNP